MNQKIIVKKSDTINGLGVFAAIDIKKGEVVEIAPLLLMPMEEFELVKQTKLYYYFFEYSDTQFAIALGFGSLYNHSFSPNARYRYDYKGKTLKFTAIKNISKDDEIFVNYNYYPNDQTKLGDWFKE